MTTIKPSRFNLYYGRKTGVLAYNTASGGHLHLSEAACAQLQSGPASLPLLLRTQALRAGLLVHASVDELLWYESEYQRTVHDTTRASYICLLTYRCNLRCPYCFEKAPAPEKVTIDENWASKLASAIERRCESQRTRELAITVFGGEPLIYFDVALRLLKRLRGFCRDHNGMKFLGIMSTNAVLLTDEMVRELAPLLDVVQVTFDGPREIHDTIRVGPGRQPTFDPIVRAIHKLLKAKVRVHIRAQVAQTYADRMGELVEELRREGVLGSELVTIAPGAIQKLSKWSRCDEGLEFAPPGTVRDKRLALSESQLPSRGAPARQIIPCVMTANSWCITPELTLFKCVAAVKKPGALVGHISDAGEFVLNERCQEYIGRTPSEFPECRDCAYLPLCGGGCPTGALERYGSYARPDCAHNKAILDQRILRSIPHHGMSRA